MSGGNTIRSEDLTDLRRKAADDVFYDYDFSGLGEYVDSDGWENGFDGDREYLEKTIFIEDENPPEEDGEDMPPATVRGKFVVVFVGKTAEIDYCDAYIL